MLILKKKSGNFQKIEKMNTTEILHQTDPVWLIEDGDIRGHKNLGTDREALAAFERWRLQENCRKSRSNIAKWRGKQGQWYWSWARITCVESGDQQTREENASVLDIQFCLSTSCCHWNLVRVLDLIAL